MPTGVSATKTFDFTIASAPTLGTLSQTQWTVNQAGYSATIAISNGTSPYSNLSVTGLPTGLTASLSGSTITITGTPTRQGPFGNISVSVTDTAGATVTQTYSMMVNSPVAISPTSVPVGTLSTPYSQDDYGHGRHWRQDLVLFGGRNVAARPVDTPASPATNTFSITGTPTAAGSATITITATDSSGATTTNTVTVTAAGLSPNRPRWLP